MNYTKIFNLAKHILIMKTGIANLPLHYGKAPRWLFDRMVRLSGSISKIIILEYGQDEFLRRISNPFFFQALGCVIGFDFHSSGLTTTTCGALKEGLKEKNIGIMVAGGKGKASRKTPDEIKSLGEGFNLSDEKIKNLVYSSRMSAKVDNNLVQDGFSLYHHSFFLSEKGKWAVVQQGMENKQIEESGRGYARRYHWLSDDVRMKRSYIKEPQSAICCDKKGKDVLNLTARENKEVRKISLDLVRENPIKLKKCMKPKKIVTEQKTLFEYAEYNAPSRHYIKKIDLGNFNALLSAYEMQPRDYEELVAMKGMGAKTLRALALISSLVYGAEISWRDPAKYSFCVGGKDGVPFPVDKKLYDSSIEILNSALRDARLERKTRLNALKRLKGFVACQSNSI